MFYAQDPHAYRLDKDGKQQERLKSGDVLTGSGLSDTQGLYSREAHRKRALEMYTRSAQQLQATATSPATTLSPAGVSPDYSQRSFTPLASIASPENLPPATPSPGIAFDTHEGPFPLIMETIQLFQPSISEVKEKENPKKQALAKARFENNISVSGSYIPPPPEQLGFARRTGKFHPSGGSPNQLDAAQKPSKRAMTLIRPHLRILHHGEETNQNY